VNEERTARRAAGKPQTEAERRLLASRDGLGQWIGGTLVRALRMKADEIQYERGRNGLTVQFRKGNKVLEAMGPFVRYQDKAIARLIRMGQQGLPRRSKDESGRFLTVVDGREWNTPLFYTETRSGERIVVRFTSSRPYKPA
jgi:type II secretory ATPase GspE/PulE/Tfp pilus assembly ATPase PilB-like protein